MKRFGSGSGRVNSGSGWVGSTILSTFRSLVKAKGTQNPWHCIGNGCGERSPFGAHIAGPDVNHLTHTQHNRLSSQPVIIADPTGARITLSFIQILGAESLRPAVSKITPKASDRVLEPKAEFSLILVVSRITETKNSHISRNERTIRFRQTYGGAVPESSKGSVRLKQTHVQTARRLE
ncbi:unnamed protein product [Medioppia subpectinata]|uniref:Uncharacterized protein n=1 Tax=Medioppia subpectinata TaxID=1979941 RepID=A0A7R9PTF0_9ACAR|nr:unnamed protein product [Medioppia subpectinata]CAG2100564.1 unnamed protein product [Medioppia subpectinata]